MNNIRRLGLISLLLLMWSMLACAPKSDVNLYVALDQEHSQRIIQLFTRETGLQVKARFDTEASKTIGLVSAIIEEADRPRCDVFWNNEIAHTARLGQKGMLAPYASPSAKEIPAAYQHPANLWTGFAARARILIINKDLIPDAKNYPKSIWDFLDPKWKGKCGIARPLTGTTLTHFTALRLSLGPERFAQFLDGLFANEVVFLQSNGATMRQTCTGKLAFALTDTDDFHVALRKGHPVAAVFPDQGADKLGTMLIPNSVAIIKDAPHPQAAKILVDFILSERVEGLLAAARSAQIPLRSSVKGPPETQILPLHQFTPMAWSVQDTAATLKEMTQYFAKRFGQ